MLSEYLRLGFATVVVLLPGRLIARALGQRGVSVTLAWALVALFVAWACVFTVHGTIWLAAGVLAAIALTALGAWVWFGSERRRSARWRAAAARAPAPFAYAVVALAGVVLGLALWGAAGAVSGDGLFHLHVVLMLVDVGDLHLRTVDQFKNGGLHPGYAFPLWHGCLALVSKLSGLSPYVVVDHEASLLAPLALLVVFEAGTAVFGSVGGGFAVLTGTLGLYCFAAGHGGSYVSLALPATAARQLLVPAFYALFFGYLRSKRRVDLVALSGLFGSLALIHSTYALFSLLPLGAYALVRLSEWRRSATALAATLLPGLAVYLWLRPLVEETLTHNPTATSECDALLLYAPQLVVSSLGHYRLAAGVVGRTGAVAVAALALVPLAGFSARRRWGAFVLGGSILVLALMLIPVLFVHFSDLVTLSQSRRAAGFLPFAFAFAGGFVLLSRSLLILPLALLAGIALQELWPGDFAAGNHGGPAQVTWFALLGGALALALGLAFARRSAQERPGLGALAAALFAVPVAAHGFSHWSALTPRDPDALSPALRSALSRLPARTVVIATTQTSYEILADFPLYVVAAPLAHVAHTRANDPQARIDAVAQWFKTGSLVIPQTYGATWAVTQHGKLYPLKYGSRTRPSFRPQSSATAHPAAATNKCTLK